MEVLDHRWKILFKRLTILIIVNVIRVNCENGYMLLMLINAADAKDTNDAKKEWLKGMKVLGHR